MVKKVYVIHRWHGDSVCDWIPWLKDALEKKGFEVIVPDMPDTHTPEIVKWVGHLAEIATTVDENSYFVGHSVGCQTILRYLQELPQNKKVGGAVLVAPWIDRLTNLEEGEPEIAKPWLETPIAWDKINMHTKNFTVIYSDNDIYVPVNQVLVLKMKLNAKLVLDMDRGHFTDDDDVTQLPILLKEIFEIAQ